MKAKESPETYPIQFKDKIDEYLWKEHHILGGCCSSIEEMKYSVAREVAEKLTDAFIEKACEYFHRGLEDTKVIDDYRNTLVRGIQASYTSVEEFIEDFKKYMEGE